MKKHSNLSCLLTAGAKVLLVFVLWSMTIARAQGQARDSWLKKTDFAGAARSAAIGLSIDNKGYIGLGNVATSDFWEYDPANDTWTQKADYPAGPKEKAVAFSIGKKGYVGTGRTVSSNTQSKEFYEYDPGKNTWVKKADLPIPLSSGTAFALGGKGYVGTGISGTNYTREFYEYDPEKNVWSRKADFGGVGRYSAVAFAIGDKGYLGTGWQQSQILQSDFWEYSPQADTWTRKASYPFTIADAVGFNIGSKGYIGVGTNQFGYAVEFYEYDVAADAWSVKAPYANNRSQTTTNYVPRYMATAFSLNGKGYVGTGHFGGSFKNFYEYTPCGDKNFDANFEHVQTDLQVNYSTPNVPGVTYSWDFGDGTKATGATVLHTYKDIGNYKVTLNATSACYADTYSKNVSVNGLKGILNNRGGNLGTFTANIAGAGIKSITLSKNGQQIAGENIHAPIGGFMTATFNLDRQTQGTWDVVAVFNDNKTVTIPQGFTIEDAISPKLSVQLTGESRLRVGFEQTYTLTYTNTGNTQASLVPLLITGLPLGTDIELIEETFPINSVPGFDATKHLLPSLNRTITDSTQKICYRLLYLNTIPGNSSGTLHFIFHLPSDIGLGLELNLNAVIGESYNSQPVVNKTAMANDSFAEKSLAINSTNWVPVAECIGSLFDLVGSGISATAKKKNPLILWTECGIGVAGIVNAAFQEYDTRSKGQTTKPLDMVETSLGAFSTYATCAKAALGTAFPEAGLLVSAIEVVDFIALSVKKQNTFGKCQDLLKKADESKLSVITANAADPNEKYGPGDLSPQHYTNLRSLSYVIAFENMPSANLSAQTVTVTDTLKKGYNLSSFGFTSVTIGDSVLRLPGPVKSFIYDFDFVKRYGVKCRVVASFDEVTGIAQWKFFTIDPATNQVTTKALDGFLPPNRLSPEGQGYVTYQVSPAPGTATGDMVQNQAFITFDYNPVIATGIWKNVFDFVAPQSKMQALAANSNDATLKLQWGGTDNLSGISRYTVYYAVNNGAFEPLLYDVPATSYVFKGQRDSTYKFYCVASDNAGNTEAVKNSAEAITTIVIPQQQVMTFPALGAKVYGAPDFEAGATVSSKLPITYQSSNTQVATITNGMVHITGAGTTEISASQAGTPSYPNAVSISRTLTVTKAMLAIAAENKSRYYNTANPDLSAAYTGLVYQDSPASLTMKPVLTTSAVVSSPVGKYTIGISGAVSNNYTISYTNGLLDVLPGLRNFTFDAIPAKNYGDPDFKIGASVGTGETISFQSSNPAVATVIGDRLHIVSAGETKITANLPVNTNYGGPNEIVQPFTVNKASQQITFSSVPLLQRNGDPVSLQVTTSSGLPVKLTLSDLTVARLDGTLLQPLRVGRATVTANQEGNANYLPAQPVSQDIEVSDASNAKVRVHPAVSADGDGMNDFLMIEGIGSFPENQLVIVNRSGAKVFEITGYNNQNRVFKGKTTSGNDLPAGTYYYVLSYQENGQSQRKTGYFILKY